MHLGIGVQNQREITIALFNQWSNITNIKRGVDVKSFFFSCFVCQIDVRSFLFSAADRI